MKLHQFLFYFLILLLPVQLGKHFWPGWAMVNGLRVDYLSPTVYLTDIIIFSILGLWGIEKIKCKMQNAKCKITIKKSKLFLFLFSFLVFLLINCFFAPNQPAAFYKLFKIIEFSLLGFYIVKNIKTVQLFNCSIVTVIIYSSIIAILQFVNQGSIGGIFYWLGERTFDAGTPGIALANFHGQLFLRPYAIFPHPNVLAGFLVISLLLLKDSRNLTSRIPGILYYAAFAFGSVALFLTFSHIAWLVFGGAVLFKLLRSPKFPGLLKIIILLLSPSTFYFLLSTFPIQSESFFQRQDFNLAAVEMIRSSPLFGVGLNNFLVELPKYYLGSGQIRLLQPAHNIFLLTAAETGILTFIIIIIFIILTIRRLILATNYQILTTLFAVLALGFFDHYFLTLQSGQLLLTLVLGLSWCKINS